MDRGRKFFSSKRAGGDGSKPCFDIRSTLYQADHLKSTAKSTVKSFKFFTSKNNSRSNSPSVPSPNTVLTKSGNKTTTVPAKKEPNALQASKTKASDRNGSTNKPIAVTTSVTNTRSRKRTEPESENRENQVSPSRPVSSSKATLDSKSLVKPRSPVRGRNASGNVKDVKDIAPPSPTKQSKRIRAEEPDPVDDTVITGRRVTRASQAKEIKKDVKKPVLTVTVTPSSSQSSNSSSNNRQNGIVTRGSPLKNYGKKIPPVKKSLSETPPSSQPLNTSLDEEQLQLPNSDESYQLPDPIKLIDDEDPLPPDPEPWGKKLGRAQLMNLFSSPVKAPVSPVKPVVADVLPPPPPQPMEVEAAPLEAVEVVTKPKKKFFTSRTTSQKEEAKKSKLDFKSFFKEDLDDSFVSSTQAQQSSSSSTQQSTRSEEEWYTIQRVRKAHQCHESGETESFDEDIKYYLNGLEKCNPIRIRCLSIESLSAKCMGAEFRMHLRAHDDMPKIISALSDAPSNPNLAFCTAALMFVYNQDRLTMDIDPNHLSLMLDLLEVKDDSSSEEKPVVDKVHSQKAKEMVEQLKTKGHGKFLDPNNLSTGKLGLEALLGLTSKRAGDWFKEELRNLKGLDFLMNTVISTLELNRTRLPPESELSKVDRTLRVLEAATYMHEVNQLYCIDYQGGNLITSCIKLLKLCQDSIICSDSRGSLTCLLSVLRVFTNMTSESSKGSRLMGTQFRSLFDLFLELLFDIPTFVPSDNRFDLMVLLLCLCINFVEFCTDFRQELLGSETKLKSLVEILLKRIQEAKETEQQADDLLETAEKEQMANEVVNIDTLLTQVVAKSGKHMEHSIIAACVSLLLGCSVQDNPDGKETVGKLLPEESFDPLLDVLRKLHEFAHLADIMTPTGVRRVERILKVFRSDDEPILVPEAPSSPSLMSISESFLNETVSDTVNETDDSITTIS